MGLSAAVVASILLIAVRDAPLAVRSRSRAGARTRVCPPRAGHRDRGVESSLCSAQLDQSNFATSVSSPPQTKRLFCELRWYASFSTAVSSAVPVAIDTLDLVGPKLTVVRHANGNQSAALTFRLERRGAAGSRHRYGERDDDRRLTTNRPGTGWPSGRRPVARCVAYRRASGCIRAEPVQCSAAGGT